ncbi:extracellular solute-binding protein [Mesorhizobium sp.]|uniref:extracellular solute-binding protein n=1 Tax=Mesorhizobium sp. TaxID=1871066 RepID=UPI00257C713A|nr:extracellular solute-binding protein [Mesorhizobium sp.]
MTQNGKSFHLSRRHLLQLGAGAAAFAATSGTAALAQSSPPTELLVTGGGGDFGTYLQKAYYDGFQAASGIKVSPQPYKGLAELKAMVEAKAWGQADVLLISAGEAAIAEKLGLSEPLDYSLVKSDDLLKGSVGKNYFLTNVASSVLAWNTDTVKAGSEPKTWVDFFNPSNRMPRALFKNWNQTFEIALLGAGVPIDKLYPLDVDLALKTLSDIRDTIRWYEGGAQSQQMLGGGEVDMAMLWVNRADGLVSDGKPVKYLNTNTVLDGDAIVIPAGHPNKEKAMKFAAYLATPEPQARLTNLVALGPSNVNAVPLIDPTRLAKTATAPEFAATNRFQDFAWLAENGDRLTEMFNKWLLG